MRQYYHICTEGLGNDLIFRTDKDYIRGMNAIGILAYRHGISILAFCLMDNHVNKLSLKHAFIWLKTDIIRL